MSQYMYQCVSVSIYQTVKCLHLDYLKVFYGQIISSVAEKLKTTQKGIKSYAKKLGWDKMMFCLALNG